jgi:hypothetical protein
MEPYGLNVHRNSPLEVFYNGQPLQLAKWPNQVIVFIQRNRVSFETPLLNE